MTDLEDLFRPLIDESAPYREPVDVIEARVSEQRVRRRRTRAQYRFGAAFLAVALIATAVGVVHARGDGSPARPGHVAVTTTSSVPSVVVPAGWSTYDYGLARLSIPPGWTAGSGCPGPHELLLTDPTNDNLGCGAGGTPSIDVSPLAPIDATHGPYVPNATINGIAYQVVSPKCLSVACGLIVHVPALNVSLSFSQHVDSAAFLKTLTYSTYARVLQQPFGAVPSSWKTVTFDGFSVRVPADWPTVDLRKAGFCYPVRNTTYLGTSTMVANCPFEPAVQPPRASLHLASTDVSSPPTEAGGWHHNGLRFAPQSNSPFTPLAQVLSLDVDGPRGRLVLGLGLGLDPAVARGILGSLKPVG